MLKTLLLTNSLFLLATLFHQMNDKKLTTAQSFTFLLLFQNIFTQINYFIQQKIC